jgi:hypothetical protein
MLSANLVGFVIGTEGISYMLTQLTGSLQGVCLRWLGTLGYVADDETLSLFFFLSLLWGSNRDQVSPRCLLLHFRRHAGDVGVPVRIRCSLYADVRRPSDPLL